MIGLITRDVVQKVIEATGEGGMASFHALKKNDGDIEKAVDYLRRSGRLVAYKPRVNIVDQIRKDFEFMWRERFGFEMRRGEGRAGYGLKINEETGKYVSDKAQFAWEIWQEAKK